MCKTIVRTAASCGQPTRRIAGAPERLLGSCEGDCRDRPVTARLAGRAARASRPVRDRVTSSEYEEVAVPATTLDHEFEGMIGPFAMWMDVEGAAKDVLSGARRFLDQCDIAKIEVEERAFWKGQWLVPDVVAEMALHGLEPLARDVEGEGQYNVLFGSQRLLSRSDVRNQVAQYEAQMLTALRTPESQ
ncbi:FkbM family methyltransferase [Streptomyces sp. NPDC001680]